jgi:hypothetical protein
MHEYILLIVGINAVFALIIILRAILKQGRKNASRIYPPARLNVVYRRKLVNEIVRRQRVG